MDACELPGRFAGGHPGALRSLGRPLVPRVAEFGYTDPNTDPHSTVFFPLLPLLLRALHTVGLSYLVAGVIISTAASIVAGAYLFQLAEDEMGEGSGRRALLYMLLFPTAVFLIAPYSEALFLAGAIAAFYYARSGRWLLVALPGAVAVGARGGRAVPPASASSSSS